MADKRGIKAGGAFVELFADDTLLARGLAAGERRLRAWGASLTLMGAKALGVGLGFEAMAFQFSSSAVAAGQLSQRTGIAVGEVSALAFASERAGGSVEGLEHSLLHMSRTITSAVQGSHEAMMALTRLRLNAYELSRLDPSAALKKIATAVAAIPNPMERAALAQGVFGRGVLELMPLLNRGAAGIEEFEQRARDLGLTISAADVALAREFKAAWVELTGSLKRIVYEIGGALVPALKAVFDEIRPGVTKVVEWVHNNRGLVASIGQAALALIGLGAALTTVGLALKGVGAAIGLIRSGLSVMGSLVSFLTTPVGLITAALAVGVVAFFKYTKAGQDTLGDLKDTALDTWTGLKDAIEAGDLGAALDVVLAGLGLAWQQTWGKMSKYFKDTWSDMKLVFLDAIGDMVLGSGFLTKAFLTFGTTVDKILNKVGAPSPTRTWPSGWKRPRPGAELAGSDAGRKALSDAIKANAAKNQRDERGAHQDDFDKDLKDAQDRLAAANAKAADARERARRLGLTPPEVPGGAPYIGQVGGTTAGTFAGFAAERMGGGGSPAERTARAAEQMVKLQKDILDWWKNQGVVFT